MESKESSRSRAKSSHLLLNLIPPIFLTVVAVVFTVLVTKVDVQPVGTEGTNIGFATINLNVHSMLSYDKAFHKMTEILGVVPFFTIAFFVVLGVVELAKRKSLRQIDKELFCLLGLYAAVLVVYAVFEKLAINYRPLIIGEAPEASYPSSHTLFAMTLCGSAIMVLPQMFGEKYAGLVKLARLTLMMIALAIVFGRLLAGVHWLTDVIGGALISAALLSFFQFFINRIEVQKGSLR